MAYTSQSSIDRRRALASALGSSAPTPGRYGPLADALRAFGGYRGGVITDQQQTENEKLRKQDMARILSTVTGNVQGISPIRPDAPMATPEGQEAATSFEMQRALAKQKGESELAKALATQRPPTSVQEWEHAQSLPEDQRSAYLAQIKPPVSPYAVNLGQTTEIFPDKSNLGAPPIVKKNTPTPAAAGAADRYMDPGEKKRRELEVQKQFENEQNKIATRETIYSAMASAAELRDYIDTAKKSVNAWSTGFLGSVFDAMKSSDAYALQAALKPIRSSISLDRLIELKQSGGTLGAVSNQELELLETDLGALDPGVGKERFIEQLESIVNRSGDIWRRINAAYQRKYGEPGPGSDDEDAAIEAQADALLEELRRGK